jgi:two-component system chemotaxis sensor kinase CheA
MTTIDMTQFYQVFFEESEEHLAAMEALLLELDIEHPDPEQLNAIFRAAHSIKGSSGTFGFTDLTDVTHILESLLDRLRKNEIPLRADMVDAFLEAGDVLKTLLAGHRGDGGADPQTVETVCARLKSLAENRADSAPAVAGAAQQTSGAAAVAPVALGKDGRRCYDIEFVPTAHAAADAAIIHGLLEELRGFGELQIITRPDPAGDGAGYWHLRLRTVQSAERFGESIDFIAEQDAWRVHEVLVESMEDAGGAFGFFESAAGSPVVDDRFGLFADAPGAPTQAAPGASVGGEGEAYGFFEPLVAAVVAPTAFTSDLQDGEGFGFFAPLEQIPVPAVAALRAAHPEDGEGFGFFEPLPERPVEPASAAPASVQPKPEPAAEAPPSPLPAETAPATVARARSTPSTAVAETSSIRVGVEKVDQLINLVGELVITQAMLLQCAEQMHGSVPERLVQGLGQLERNTRDLQESVMSIRMLPISFVFSRFPRVVRDLSAKLGKLVELKMSGETTELDKGLIEKIADPLTHLIRNSLDHGIEMPDKRTAAGKNPTGTITLRAAHQGGNIVIEVGDDGGGLSRPKILAKARERGFQVSDQMTDVEVWMLIFEAGFSTAEVVTDVSGRGVGMDVVRRNIQAMGGRVEIESMTGVGTRMTVRLPLTLAILDGMSVAVGSQTYILPLSYVIESVQPDLRDVKTLSNQARVIRVRGEYLPVIVLHEIFGIKPASANLTQGIMVILDADGMRAALFVDALIGQHQVVIKSLENNFRRVAGISGATIMGDGHVALILDISALAAMAKSAQLAAA